MRIWLFAAVLGLVHHAAAQVQRTLSSTLDDPCAIDSSNVFTIVEQMPQFPGGEAELFKYLGRTISYPKCPGEEMPPSTVMLTFVVRYDGNVCDVELVRGASCVEADQLWLSMIRSMPQWEPGKQRGEAVNVRYTLPVRINWK